MSAVLAAPKRRDWKLWRQQEWERLQRHCDVHVSEQHASASNDVDVSSDLDAAPQTTLLKAVTSDLATLSDMLTEATKMRAKFGQLKEWEQDGLRDGTGPRTLLTDAVSDHPLSNSDGLLQGGAPSSPSSFIHPLKEPPAKPLHSYPTPRPTTTQRLGASTSNRSEKSSRSKTPSNKRDKPSIAKSRSTRKPRSLASAHDATRDQRPTLDHSDRRCGSPPVDVQPTSASGGPESSGAGTPNQSGADAQAIAGEIRLQEKQRRRAMAQRVGRDVRAARTAYNKKQRAALDLDWHDERTRSGDSNAPSVGSLRDRASAFTARPGTTHVHNDDEWEDMYRRAWSKYVTAWDALLKAPASAADLFTFQTFPWPTLSPPSTLEDLNTQTIRDFIHHACRARPTAGGGAATTTTTNTPVETKVALHEARLRWHPDRTPRWMAHVGEGEKGAVKRGADVVIRVMNDLAAEEGA